MVTRRSDSARRRRRQAASTSSSTASLRAAWVVSRSPIASRRAESPARVASMMIRSSTSRWRVSAAISHARYSEIRPARSAAPVQVRSGHRATRGPGPGGGGPGGETPGEPARPARRSPDPGRSAGTPAAAARARCESSNPAVTQAWAPSAAHFNSSRARNRSTRAASSRSSSAEARAAVQRDTAAASITGAVTAGRSEPLTSSNTCSRIVGAADARQTRNPPVENLPMCCGMPTLNAAADS